LLLKNKADVNLKDNFGCTSLYIATKIGDKELVETLLKNNADPNIQSDTGNSPLIAGKWKF
jgi:ankyrin repeat protein